MEIEKILDQETINSTKNTIISLRAKHPRRETKLYRILDSGQYFSIDEICQEINQGTKLGEEALKCFIFFAYTAFINQEIEISSKNNIDNLFGKIDDFYQGKFNPFGAKGRPEEYF